MNLEDFARTVLDNTCGRAVRDSADHDRVVYNAVEVPRERQEVLYTYDLHCAQISVWVKHTDDGPVIIEHKLEDC